MLYLYAGLIMLDFVAIILVINEDIFYEIEDKIFKIFWILIIPLFGAMYAMHKLNTLHNYTGNQCSRGNINDDIRTYEAVDSSGGFGGGE